MSICFFVGSANILFAAIYQGFGNGNYSMYLVFMRQMLALLPLLLLAAYFKRLNQVWLAFIIAETIAIPFGMVLYKKIQDNNTVIQNEDHTLNHQMEEKTC